MRMRRIAAVAAGAGVLFACGVLWWHLLEQRQAAGPERAAGASDAAASARRVSPLELDPARAVAGGAGTAANDRLIGGIVRRPDGRPIAGATVTLHRAVTAWPEWRSTPIDQAVTGTDGAFRFRFERHHGLLVHFEHSSYAGWVEEVPVGRAELELHLQPGFEIAGLVTNDSGLPMANARVALESVAFDQRRATSSVTAANGTFAFANVPAGPVRITARHDWWQPAVLPAVVVGETSRVELKFDRPAVAPLRGRVVAAATQAPIAGASIVAVAPNARLGLVDAAAATTGADGTFLLAGLARGTLRLLVRHEDHGAVWRTVAIGAASAELLLEMPPRTALSGRLVAGPGAALAFDGQVLQVTDSSGELATAVVDAAGRFAFASPLSPGWATFAAPGAPFGFQRTYAAASVGVRIAEAQRSEVELDVVPATRIHGRVLGPDRKPLAGARIWQTRVLAENARWIGDAAAQLDIGNVGSQVARLVAFDRDVLLATSGADGSFEAFGLAPGLCLVRCELPGFGTRWQRIAVASGGRTTEVADLVMAPGCRVEGRVLRGRRPVAGVLVSLISAGSQAAAVTGRDGTFAAADLQAGVYEVRARLPAMAAATATTRIGVHRDGPAWTADTLQLELPVGRTVRGTVQGTDGQPLASAMVTVRGQAGQPTVTDASGAFALELPERAVELQVSLGDRGQKRVVPVLLGQDSVSVRLDTEPVCTLSAQVAGLPARMRLPGVLLRTTRLDESAAGDAQTRWVEMQNGELRWSFCPTGRVRVEIWCDGYAPFVAERDFAANEEYGLGDVLLERGSELQGRVVDATGEPVGNAQVFLGEESDLDLFEPRVRSAADGTFRIGGVSNRSASLVVRAQGFAPRTVALRLPQDVLAAEPLRCVLEPGSTIEVVTRGGGDAEGGFVLLRRQGRVLASAELDERGRALFPHRTAGAYTVQRYGADAAPVEVVVPSSGKVVRAFVP